MKRAVRNLFRVIAVALAVFGIIEISLEFFRQRLHEGGISWTQLIIGGALIIAGIVLFALSGRLAAKLTDDFEG